MIFPGDFKTVVEKPSLKISWIVVFLNVIVFIMVKVFFENWPNKNLQEKINNQTTRNTVVEMYKQSMDPIEYKKINGQSVNAIYTQALKDRKFWSRVSTYPFTGDQVQIASNKKIITDFYKSYLESPQYQFGLGALEASPWSWVTYQFVHSSWVHLVGNILVIFLIISYLELSVSSIWIMATYLFSGFAGGISFLYFDTIGGMSVVGASACASGLLAFLLTLQGNKVMPWGYMVAPIRGGYGQIYLPVFFIFPIFLVSDFVTLLWEPNGVSSNIAVSAHAGGTLMGFFMGAAYLLFFRSKTASHSIFGDDDWLHELS